MYVAGKRIKVGDGYRNPGDPVPEAAFWPNLRAHINTNQIVVVPDRAPVVATDKPPEPVKAAAPAPAAPGKPSPSPAPSRRR